MTVPAEDFFCALWRDAEGFLEFRDLPDHDGAAGTVRMVFFFPGLRQNPWVTEGEQAGDEDWG